MFDIWTTFENLEALSFMVCDKIFLFHPGAKKLERMFKIWKLLKYQSTKFMVRNKIFSSISQHTCKKKSCKVNKIIKLFPLLSHCNFSLNHERT